MEGVAPPLKCLIELQSAMQNGEPVRSGATRYIQSAPMSDDYAPALRAFLFAWDQGQDWKSHVTRMRSPQRRALTELIAVGLTGQLILPHLEELKAEIVSACDAQIRHELEMLPLKMLAPLLLLQFPAFLVLLFGPLLARLIQELNR